MTVTINGSTGFAFPDGTATAPSIAHFGDSNCGLYFPTADSIAAVTNGTPALTISSSQVLTLANALPVGSGGTGLTALTAGYIPFGAGTSAFGNTSNLFWDNTNTRLGIGTASPAAELDVRGGANISDGTTIIRTVSASGIGYFGTTGAYPLALRTNNTVQATLDTSGNLGLGVTPSAWSTGKALEVGALGNALWGVGASNCVLTSNVYYNSSVYKYANTAAASQYQQYNGAHQWYSATSGTQGATITAFASPTMTLDASGNLSAVGQISTTKTGNFFASNGASTTNQYFNILNTGGSFFLGVENSSGGSLATGTAAYSTVLTTQGSTVLSFGTNLTERARIDTSGNLLVGTTTNSGRLTVKQNADAAGGAFALIRQANTNNWQLIVAGTNDLYLDYNAADKGYFSNSTGTYTAVSDKRLKKDIVDIAFGLTEVINLRPVEYLMNDDDNGSVKHLGFIAQEVIPVIPNAVSKMVNGMYGMDKTALIPVLVKAIQELAAKVQALEAKVA